MGDRNLRNLPRAALDPAVDQRCTFPRRMGSNFNWNAGSAFSSDRRFLPNVIHGLYDRRCPHLVSPPKNDPQLAGNRMSSNCIVVAINKKSGWKVPQTEKYDSLIAIFGDQLCEDIHALRLGDREKNLILMAEVMDEATYAHHHKKN